MFLGRVIGSVVSTKKDDKMSGRKLLLIRPMLIDEKNPSRLRPGQNTLVAVDNLGAGVDELILFAQGSSARQASGLKSMPIDAAVVGIVDAVDVLGKKVYKAEA
ncbi:MAG: EutN/CcmL family microcompartment protein [Verrucomicrobiota bacterium]|jgi:ethanolamine utilization protein EutN